jgi:hypothetical protein
MKIGEIYFYDHTVAQRIRIIMADKKEFDFGRMGLCCKSIYATYSLVSPSILGVWNDDSRD